MSITDQVDELKHLDIEIKRIKKELKVLQSNRRQCEKNIIAYLESNNQPGLKSSNMIIVLKTQTQQRRKSKKKQDPDEILRVLQSATNGEELIDHLFQAMSKTPIRKSYLNIKYI